ncbi:hypothetical protein ABBQ38_010477 [Trebouxia sp. C0009 RCD-2024]
MTSATAETVLREASTVTAWHKINAYLSSQQEEVQWRGVRLLHIKLQQGPGSAAEFAELPDCRSRIDVLVQLLTNIPATDPMNHFPLDVSASTSMHIGRPPKDLIQQVMQAQMVGLVLGVLAQLALADSYCLAQHIYKVEGLQLMHDIAVGRTQHAHPELQDASEVKRLRPDVHEKLFQMLLPLAISSIYEVTFSRETYSAQVAAMARHAADNSHRQIALQFKDSLNRLQHPALLDAADAPAGRQAEANHTLRHIVFKVTSAEVQSGYVGELQHAWQSAVGGYNERQAGNCLFWLFEEPQANHGIRNIETGSVASGEVQNHGQQTEDAGPSIQHAGDVQQDEQGVQLTGRATQHANETGNATRASTLDRTSSHTLARPAARPSQSADGEGGSGWSAGHVVLAAVTAFAFGVLVGGYSRRSSGIDGLSGISETYLNIVGKLMTEVLQERQQNRRTANGQERERSHHY